MIDCGPGKKLKEAAALTYLAEIEVFEVHFKTTDG